MKKGIEPVCSYCGGTKRIAFSVDMKDSETGETTKKRVICWECIVKVLDNVLGEPSM